MRMPLCLTMEIPKAIDFQFLRRSIEGIEYGGFPTYIHIHIYLFTPCIICTRTVYIYTYIYINVTCIYIYMYVHVLYVESVSQPNIHALPSPGHGPKNEAGEDLDGGWSSW